VQTSLPCHTATPASALHAHQTTHEEEDKHLQICFSQSGCTGELGLSVSWSKTSLLSVHVVYKPTAAAVVFSQKSLILQVLETLQENFQEVLPTLTIFLR